MDTEIGVMQSEVKESPQPQDAEQILPWSLRRERGLADTSVLVQ